jgi:7-keto-8-aminopelargonate synthetase-like enzyme
MNNGFADTERLIATQKAMANGNFIFQKLDPQQPPDPALVSLKGRVLKNFSNGDYMGFQEDERVKKAAMEAIEKHGILLASSRAYLTSWLSEELESKLQQITGHPTFVTRSTTYASITTIPMIIGSQDAIILDHQVHSSVQLACGLAAAQGVHIERIPHNDMNALEDKVKTLSPKYQRIWYLFDGVFSMVGDHAPFEDIARLMDQYPQLYGYCDDAWGMCWTGENGRGLALSRLQMNSKLVVVSSLMKGFGAGGGGMVIFSESIQRDIVRDLSPLQIFSGPLTNSILGSAIAVANIHLSPEITQRQAAYIKRMELMHQTATALGLPLASSDRSPVCFVKLGKVNATIFLLEQLIKEGYYTNLSTYPLVPAKLSGVRIVINSYVSDDDIRGLVAALAHYYPQAIAISDEVRG